MAAVKPKVELLNYSGEPEKIVALAAKLCYSNSSIGGLSENISKKSQAEFIEKLLSFGHTSPIEHISFTFGTEGVSRALLAQITRHRIASFSVQSQRYVSSEGFNYIIPRGIESLGREAVDKFVAQMDTIQGFYNEWQSLLDEAKGKGEASNEDARFVLPNAAETKFVLTLNARSLLNFFELRCCFRAQWEIREVAYLMLKHVKAVAPTIFKNAGPSCFSASCKEGKMSCGRVSEVKKLLSK
ncbi:MAG: FAD-dependent thymidylate synthase [Firmicutes bacterium]|nr:FAD-dependent thymidylate synthase [Bacillota bacterium]